MDDFHFNRERMIGVSHRQHNTLTLKWIFGKGKKRTLQTPFLFLFRPFSSRMNEAATFRFGLKESKCTNELNKNY